MAPTSNDLVQWLARAAQGDRLAFQNLYHATSAKLLGIALRILKRRDLAEDVLQDVYVKIWHKAGEFDGQRASPITWMATITRNRALDEVRRRGTVALDDVPDVLAVADETVDALSRLMQSEDGQRLKDCIDGLEPERRDLVVRAYLDGESRDALALRLGRPVNTIKTWLHRSLHQLKLCLGS